MLRQIQNPINNARIHVRAVPVRAGQPQIEADGLVGDVLAIQAPSHNPSTLTKVLGHVKNCFGKWARSRDPAGAVRGAAARGCFSAERPAGCSDVKKLMKNWKAVLINTLAGDSEHFFSAGLPPSSACATATSTMMTSRSPFAAAASPGASRCSSSTTSRGCRRAVIFFIVE